MDPDGTVGGLITPADGHISGDLSVAPRGASFATQDLGERVYIIARRDVITNIGWITRVALLTVLPFAVVLALANFGVNVFSFLPLAFNVVITMLYFASLFTYLVIQLNRWFFNAFIVTNERILDYDFKPLTSYTVAEARLDAIQDVSQHVVGVFPSFFDYGDLFIQTAGEKLKFEIPEIPRPTWLRNVLSDLAKVIKNAEP